MYKHFLVWCICALQPWVTMAQDVEKYHDLVNRAELYITENNEEKALMLYQEAFKERFGHFSKDYYNALLCAIQMKADSLCIEYTQALAKRGVPVSFFNQAHLQYAGSVKNISALYEEISTGIDKNLVDTLKLMILEDQQYRGDNLAQEGSINTIDELNYTRVVRILKEYGYPSEQLTGTNMMRNGRRIGTRNDFDVILTHQLKNGHCELMEYLEHSLRSGSLNPEVFVTHATYCFDEEQRLGCFNKNQVVYFQIDSLIFTCDSPNETSVNKTRKQYYLCSLDDLKKKIHFAFDKTREQPYSLHCNYSITYRELNGNDLDKNVQELKKDNPGIHLFKALKSKEPYFW